MIKGKNNRHPYSEIRDFLMGTPGIYKGTPVKFVEDNKPPRVCGERHHWLSTAYEKDKDGNFFQPKDFSDRAPGNRWVYVNSTLHIEVGCEWCIDNCLEAWQYYCRFRLLGDKK